MPRKTREISIVGFIFKPIQWMWVLRWPFLVIVAPVLAGLTFNFINDYLAPERAKGKKGDELKQEQQIAQVKKDVLQITSQVLVGITVLSGAYFTWKRLEVSREDQITDRYTRAIDQLGSEKNLAIRLGGIYALERLAKDSKKDQGTVMEVLTAFVRENASLRKTENSNPSESSDEESDESTDKDEEKIPEKVNPSTDIQAILTVIGRRKWEVLGRINLSGAELSGAELSWANLSGADLSWANLSGADLSWANLSGADLSGADLSWADLSGADLSWAKLSEADLSGADLSWAKLSWADLSRAKLIEADLSRADLSRAKLIEADLSGADLSWADLSWAKLIEVDLIEVEPSGADLIGVDLIKNALNWEKATYSDYMTAKLGLLSDAEKSEGKS